MKLYKTLNYSSEGKTLRADTHNSVVFEAPDEIFLGGMAHDKDTLAPIFGRLHPGHYGHKTKLMLEHTGGKPYVAHRRTSSGSYPVITASQNHMHPVNGEHASTGLMLGGQPFMNGTTSPRRVWQSTSNPDLLYFSGSYGGYDPASWSASGRNHTHGYWYTYEMNRKTLEFRVANAGYAVHYADTYWFHENEDYVFGMSAGDYPTWHAVYSVHILRKSDMTMKARGLGSTYYVPQILGIFNDEVYIYTNQIRSTYCGAGYISKYSFATLEAILEQGQGHYTGTVLWKNASGSPHISYSVLRQGLRAGGFSADYLNRDGKNFSDGSAQDVKHHAGALHKPAVVHDAALRAVNVLRTYHMYFSGSGTFPLKISRANTEINGVVDSDNGYDFMDCTITSSKGITVPSRELFGGAGSTYYDGSNHGYQGYTLQYFQDSPVGTTRGYLLLSSAYESTSTSALRRMFYVFKITDHTASITADLTENDSLALDLIQEVDLGYQPTCFFAPDRDHKKFVAMNRDGTEHKFFSWNSTTEQFATGNSIEGEILKMGVDSQGRIFTFHQNSGGDEVHLESLSLPNKVQVEMNQDRYSYNGITIVATAKVNVFNYAGDRLSKTVNLEIVGDGANFTGAGKTKTVTSNSSSDLSVSVDITGPTFVKINATVSA
jgi:hypothetical protein